ncbi:uncharacterized protein LOC141759590 isoform X2 [Sebastes fasciatus]|uniref:uncharacterized protein LOC141759590 isoform X2 n=1 Tax=Sebastes fasciatus TaxID=394691 RepID=UPI003D9F8CBB
METKYPTLKRPKRKLCYSTNKEKSPSKWKAPLTLGDIDRMFDDLDPSSHDKIDLSPPSLLLQTFDTETNQCEREASTVPQKGHVMKKLPRCQMDPKGHVLHPATRSPSPKLVIDFDIPFKAHMPVKTSSPIEGNMVVEALDNEKDQVVCPLLFDCEDEDKEKANTEPPLLQKPQCTGHVTEEGDFEFESPPRRVVISKPQMSSCKNKVEGSSKESHPVKVKTPKKPQTPVLESKRKAPRQETADPPVSAARQEPELTAPKKITENVHRVPSVESTCIRKHDMTAFLKQLREAGKPKPSSSRTILPVVKVPTPPPELEDDFLILEDEPLWISIPSKTGTRKNHRLSRTSSTDKDSSTDKGTKDSPPETAQKQQESERTKSKLGSQTVNQKMKMRKKEKKNEVTEPGNEKDELSGPEDLPAGDEMEEEKPNKKKQRLKKVPYKQSDEEEEQPKDGASGEEKPALKTEKKAQRSDSLKVGNENAKTSRATPLKRGRKVTQGSDAVKQMMDVEAGEEQSSSSEEHADAEDLGSFSDKEITTSEAQSEKDFAAEKDKHKKLAVGSEGSSSEDDQILGNRKRRHRTTEESKVTDNQPTLKKTKRHNKEPSAAEAPSPVKAKEDRVLKKRNQTQRAPSSSQDMNIAKEKKTKRNKNRNTRRDTRPDEVVHTTEAEQFEEQEQQEVAHQDLDVHSPLVLTQRSHSLISGEQVFQRVYHHTSSERLSITPASVSPRGPQEQLRAAESGKRRRKTPGNWWTVDDVHEDVESISSQPKQKQKQKREPHQERKKQSRSPRLGTPKNGNVAVSSKPAPMLEMTPLSAPKTVKRSLATFKDILESVTETPTVVSRREVGQRNRRKVAARPAEEVAASDCPISSKTDGGIFSMDAGEPRNTDNSPPNHEIPPDSRCQSEDRLKTLRSGPSSMIELEEYDEDDGSILMPPRVRAALSVSDLCAPPLRPLVLQTKDEANLKEWFKSLWSNPVVKGAVVTPDQFDWYFYQGRAIGLQVELNGGSFCNGKILMGSYMKKPLWVDHSATTVFNLLTSSVSVTIDSKESRFHPGQSFMVPCGHAYSLQNVTAQPAVLYFTRMSAESSD